MNKITHTIDLCLTLRNVINKDQLEKLWKAGGNKYKYEMTVKTLMLGSAIVLPISGYDLMQAIIFVQKAIGDYDSMVVVLGSSEIRRASVYYSIKCKIDVSTLNPDSNYQTLDIDGVVVDIEFESWPPQRGLREGGLQLEPDEDGGFEVVGVESSGNFLELLSDDAKIKINAELLKLKEE